MKKIILTVLGAISIACSVAAVGTSEPSSLDPPTSTKQTAVFAGGCFWGVEAVFEHVKGVIDVKSGYAGGAREKADYETVSTGTTGNAESVMVTFDPTKVTYTQLLSVFFGVAHDPTQLNMQGPDHGTQYRSAIFYTDSGQKAQAMAFIDAINQSKALPKPIVTEVSAFKGFQEAEAYHQNYLARNPNDPYIVVNDLPKLEDLKVKFPDLYVDR